MKSKRELCYFCGCSSTTDEHVPPRSFFPKNKRKNLITVKSCSLHNTSYSKIDEKFRALLQLTSDSSEALKHFREKTLRGLKRKDRPGLLHSIINSSFPAILNGQETIGIEIDHSEIEEFFEKVFKALFFHHSGVIFRGKITFACSHFIHEGQDFAGLISLFQEIENSMDTIVTDQPEIFRYKIATVSESMGSGFALWITFYDTITVFSLGVETHDMHQKTATGNADKSYT